MRCPCYRVHHHCDTFTIVCVSKDILSSLVCFLLVPTITATTPDQNMVYDVRVEEGKLHYEGKWFVALSLCLVSKRCCIFNLFCSFGKNQHVIVESKDRGVET